MVHPDLLLTFATIAETSSFTAAAERLGLQQSTISQQVKRLEAGIKRPLFARDTHSVTLTSDGEALLDYARAILDLNVRVERHFSGSELRGRLRVGVSEDFAASLFPHVLREFMTTHRQIDLELTVDISGHLYEHLDGGRLDVIFAKRKRGDQRGEVAWTENLVWAARPDFDVDPVRPIPLIVFGAPSVTRAYAIEALEKAGRAWLVACTSGSLSGLRAAALAGLGVMPFVESLLPQGLSPLSEAHIMPQLGCVEFVAIGPGCHNRAAMALIQTLLANTSRLQARPGPYAGACRRGTQV